jgi:hypothetical protein
VLRKSLPPKARPIVAAIESHIQKGGNLSSLPSIFNRVSVSWALAALATIHPSQYDRLIGSPPASPAHILLDECAGPSLLETVHRTLGRGLSYEFVSGRGADDQTVFYTARDKGIVAIITRDSASRQRTDLCKIAREAYRHYPVNTNRTPPPGVILIPHGTKPAIQALTAGANRVREYLNNRESYLEQKIFYVLDLRVQEFIK